VGDRVRWGGRILALLAIVALGAYLWRVGLTRGTEIATVLALIVAIMALVAPYLFPPQGGDKQKKVTVPPTTGSQPQSGDTRRDEAALSATGVERAPAAAASGTGDAAAAPATAQSAAGQPASVSLPYPSPIATQTAATPVGGQATKADMEDALLCFSDIDQLHFRRLLLRKMGDQLGLSGPFEVAEDPRSTDHVSAIVDAIWAYRDPSRARLALVRAAERLRPQEAATVRLRELI
jgi:hypothetical protein